jgi:hypothetical protein
MNKNWGGGVPITTALNNNFFLTIHTNKCRFHQALSLGHWLLFKKWLLRTVAMRLQADWLTRGDP